jgi:DNA-binding HxlR family transcriptional regulator
MALLDLLGRRWALRVIWELREDELTFRALQARCDAISASVLNQRLTELKAAGILQSGNGGYQLTPEGRRLLELYPSLQAWAERWAERVRRGATDAG